ncbi:MAG: hypothetical protein ABI639_02445 [Thermoanaerobaculia bacterium]
MDRTNFARATSLLLALLLPACSGLAKRPVAADLGLDGLACVGKVAPAFTGLSLSSNLGLVQKTRLATDKGGVCAARVFAVTAPVVLYRVFDASKPYTEFGGWWALARPSGSRDEYRAANAICPEWSALDRLAACEIRPGTQVVLGTTQSAVCADGTSYPKSDSIQVYVPNDSRAGIVHVGNCTEETIWP